MLKQRLLIALRRSGGGDVDWGKVEARTAIVEHVFGTAGAAAGDEVADFEEGIEVANAAGGFDLNVLRGVLAHKGEVFGGRPAGAIAGAGFDPVGF